MNLRYAINAFLASLLVMLGFTSCKTTANGQDGGNQKSISKKNNDNPNRTIRVLYGPPPAKYKSPIAPEPKKLLYGPPPSGYRTAKKDVPQQ